MMLIVMDRSSVYRMRVHFCCMVNLLFTGQKMLFSIW